MNDTPKWALEKIQEAKEKQLKELDLSRPFFSPPDDRLTKIPSEVFELEQLEVLNLESNLLTTVPDKIIRLQNLRKLNLNNNRLTVVPDPIIHLPNLSSLNLSLNKLTAFPDMIAQLQNLRELTFYWNQLPIVPDSIAHLRNLTLLDFGDNKLTKVPDWIGQLHSLTGLGLAGSSLTTVPEWIAQLQNLTFLDLGNNQLTTISEPISQLQNLNTLSLHDNLLTFIPEPIFKLKNLVTLGLRSNKIKEIPLEILQLENLENLGLIDNPVETPPPEILDLDAMTGWANIGSVKNYFRQLHQQGQDHLYEAKLLIIGEAGAGKTTLAKKIQDPEYVLQEENSTQSIEVIRWEFPLPKDLPGLEDLEGLDKKFRVNLWDFGGQEIYHATHQFFLTRRSLYILVADTRKEDTDFYYWLNVVELLSDNSPLLIVHNEKQDRRRDLNERQLRGQFTNLEKILPANLLPGVACLISWPNSSTASAACPTSARRCQKPGSRSARRWNKIPATQSAWTNTSICAGVTVSPNWPTNCN